MEIEEIEAQHGYPHYLHKLHHVQPVSSMKLFLIYFADIHLREVSALSHNSEISRRPQQPSLCDMFLGVGGRHRGTMMLPRATSLQEFMQGLQFKVTAAVCCRRGDYNCSDHAYENGP